jgi:methylthioribose-1-phosphate isomerase
MPVKTIEWIDNEIRLIDQTLLPEKLVYLNINNIEVLAEAIRSLRIRGAPAIGIAAAMGVVLAARNFKGEDTNDLVREIDKSIEFLGATRPTAVNLFWALNRMKLVLSFHKDESIDQIRDFLQKEANQILDEDREICRQMGFNGAELLPQSATILTHCNAGGLATSEFGTALGVIYAAVEMGKEIKVYADETRPLLQGARLTAWELKESGIDVTVICDSASGFLMQQGKVDLIIVGADRIASNGDVANKVGTYSLAVLAEKHRIPFYVAAPISTFDFSIDSGSEIPIEQRSKEEVTIGFGKRTVPETVDVYNPAFDVTPNEFISAIVTEKGVLYPPFVDSIKKVKI